MENRKKKTFIYDGLGLPIKLINAPMKKVFGEWFIDIDMNRLQLLVLAALAHKPASLTGDEHRFIRKYLEMTTTEFGKLFGVSHVAVLKWEKAQNKISPSLELCIRLHVLNHVKDKEFRDLYNNLSLEQLSKSHKGKIQPIVIDAEEDLKIAL